MPNPHPLSHEMIRDYIRRNDDATMASMVAAMRVSEKRLIRFISEMPDVCKAHVKTSRGFYTVFRLAAPGMRTVRLTDKARWACDCIRQDTRKREDRGSVWMNG